VTNKTVHVIGGGTLFHIDSHLYLGSKAAGNTARKIAELCRAHDQTMDVKLTLTNMADHTSKIDTNEDLKAFVENLVVNSTTKIIFFNAAVVDFEADIVLDRGDQVVLSAGKDAERLRTSDQRGWLQTYTMELTPREKIVKLIREKRKDIFLIAFKQTAGASEGEQN